MKKIIISILLLFVVFISVKAQDENKKVIIHEFKKAELLKLTTIIDLFKLIEPSKDYSNYTFRTFDFSLNISGVEYTETAPGNVISQKQKDFVAKAKNGTKLYVEKIRAIVPGKREISLLPDVIIKLKD